MSQTLRTAASATGCRVGMSEVMPIIATCFGVLATLLAGMVLAKVNGIESHLERLNGKVYEHESAIARNEEQAKSAAQVGRAAHERLDAMKGGRG